MYKQDVPLNELLTDIKKLMTEGYELELSIDYNRELKKLPDKKWYKTEEVKQLDYVNFISEIYDHFRTIERQQLYEFKVNIWHDEKDVNPHYELCAMRPFIGGGYKRGGGSGSFSMRIFLTNKNLLLNQLKELCLPVRYEKIGLDFINNEHPVFLGNISDVKKHITNFVYKDIIDKVIEENYYDLQERNMTLKELQELVLDNINNKNYSQEDFEINIVEEYDNNYFRLHNKYLGKIINLIQGKEVKIDYYLDIQ